MDERNANKSARVIPAIDGGSYIILNLETLVEHAHETSKGDPKYVREIVGSAIREELIHAAYIEALRIRWSQSDQSSRDFMEYYGEQTRAIAKELVDLRQHFKATGQRQKLITLERAVAASWSIYPHDERISSVDGIFGKLLGDENVAFHFSGELVRQLVELNRDGSLVKEGRYQSLMGKLHAGLKAALSALRHAWSKVKNGSIEAEMLRRAVVETEQVLAAIEEMIPNEMAPFDVSEREHRKLQ